MTKNQKSWEKFYKDALSSENTLVCECGNTNHGSEPAINMVCLNCWEKIRDAYPEGFTCAECGEEIHDSLPVLKDGAICKKCAKVSA